MIAVSGLVGIQWFNNKVKDKKKKKKEDKSVYHRF
jgi:hypothetical protein